MSVSVWVCVCVDAYLWFTLRMVKVCGVVLTRRRCGEMFANRICACSSPYHRIHPDGGRRRMQVAYEIQIAHGGVFSRIAFVKEEAGHASQRGCDLDLHAWEYL